MSWPLFHPSHPIRRIRTRFYAKQAVIGPAQPAGRINLHVPPNRSNLILRLDYGGWGRFAVPMQTSSISLLNRYSNKHYISLDSQRIMLYNDIHYVGVKK